MRKSNIELLRIILLFFLVAWHLSVHEYGLSWAFLTIAFPAASVVPVFSMITGYFLSKSSSYTFSLKFLLTFVYLYLINLAVGSLVYGVTGDLSHGRIVWLLGFGGRDWWYLWALLILYLLAPIINRGLSLISKNYFIFMMVIFTILFFILAYWIKFEYISAGSATASGIILMLYYYLIGATIRLYLTDFLARYRKWIYLIAPLVLLILTGGVILCYVTDRDKVWRLLNISGGLTLISSIMLFVLFLEIKIKDSKVINYIASLGLVIYTFHYLSQYLILKYKPSWSDVMDVNYLINTLLSYGMSVVFAVPMTFILNTSGKWSWKGLSILNQKFVNKNAEKEFNSK